MVRYQPEKSACSRTGGRLPMLPGRDSDHPFRGLLASQLQCKVCNQKVSPEPPRNLRENKKN